MSESVVYGYLWFFLSAAVIFTLLVIIRFVKKIATQIYHSGNNSVRKGSVLNSSLG